MKSLSTNILIQSIIYTTIITCLGSCMSKTSKTIQETKVIKIDLNKRIGQKDIDNFIQKLSSITFIPLETTDESITTIGDIHVDDNYIFITDNRQKTLSIFDKNGKFINKIAKQGIGPDEYSLIYNFSVYKDTIYILDISRILCYDFKGNHIETIPIMESSRDLLVRSENEIILFNSFKDEHYIYITEKNGNVKEKQFSKQEKLSNISRIRNPFKTRGFYHNGIYFSQYYDCKIHYLDLESNTTKTLYEFDFGTSHIPEDFYSTPVENQFDVFENIKYETVMSLLLLNLTDNWIVFALEHWEDNSVIYYDRRTDQYINNKNFPLPYSVLFGINGNMRLPFGQINGKFYSYIESFELRELLTNMQDKGLLSDYFFLKDLNMSDIEEENNPFIIFYNLD